MVQKIGNVCSSCLILDLSRYEPTLPESMPVHNEFGNSLVFFVDGSFDDNIETFLNIIFTDTFGVEVFKIDMQPGFGTLLSSSYV